MLKGDIAKKLWLNGDYKNRRITNAFYKTSELQSKQVSFKVSSKLHPTFIDIENAWVDLEIDIKCQPINVSTVETVLNLEQIRANTNHGFL